MMSRRLSSAGLPATAPMDISGWHVPAPRAGPAERITLYSLAFSQRKFASFDLEFCTSYGAPLRVKPNDSQRVKLIFFMAGVYGRFEKNPTRSFRQKVRGKKQKTVTLFEAVHEYNANHVPKKKQKKPINWGETSCFRVPHRTIFTLYCG